MNAERKRKLTDWEKKYGVSVNSFETGAKWIPHSVLSREAEIGLFSLSDYVVSSLSGGTIWLVAR